MKRYKIYLVPHFHYDVEYLETYETYLKMCLGNIKEAVRIMRRHPEYKFLIEQTVLLEEFWNKYPEDREALKRFAQEGRVEIGPGMYCMPDMNIPGGESFIRQAYYGKRWLKENLGVDSEVAWIADPWGHNSQLPQIMTGCGYQYYCFTRDADRLDRKTEFYWEGIDGTKIICYWMVYGYGAFSRFTDDEERDFSRLNRAVEKIKKHSVADIIMVPNGSDFVKPQENAVERVNKWNRINKREEIVFSTPSEYFNDLFEKKPHLQVFKGEFNPDRQGSFSSRIKIKQFNRMLENKVAAAEGIFTVLNLVSDKPYPYEKLDSAWKYILLNQFHDTICGTVIDPCYLNAQKRYTEANLILNNIITGGMESLGRNIKLDPDRKHLLVFNPSGFARKEIVEAKLSCNLRSFRLFDSKERETLFQVIEKDRKFMKILFPVEVHASGYNTLSIREGRKFIGRRGGVKVVKKQTGIAVSNKFYRININERGVITSLIGRQNNIEYVDKKRPFFNDLLMQSDHGDLWLCYESPEGDEADLGFIVDPVYDPMLTEPPLTVSKRRVAGFALHSKDCKTKVDIIETGPLRATIKVTGEFSFWKMMPGFVQYIYFYNDSKRIDFRTEIMPDGKHYRFRVCFPTAIKNGKIRHEIPFGTQERPEGEYPAQNWMDYSDARKGLCIFNHGLPGNNVTEGVMMVSLFRAVDIEYKGESRLAYEEGVLQTFNYSILPYVKGEEIHLPMTGQALNSPLIVKEVKADKGNLPSSQGFFSVEPSNVILSALKKAGDGIILRVYESEGKPTDVQIEIFRKFGHCSETDLLQNKIKDVEFTGKTLRFKIKPFEIKTFRLQ